MLEIALIYLIVKVAQIFPLRGKTPDMLSEAQKQRVHKEYQAFMRTRKGRKNPNMTIDEYYPILQKNGLTLLICLLIILPLYLLVFVLIVLGMSGII